MAAVPHALTGHLVHALLTALLGTCASLPLCRRRLTSRHSGNRVGLRCVPEHRQPCLQNDPVAALPAPPLRSLGTR